MLTTKVVHQLPRGIRIISSQLLTSTCTSLSIGNRKLAGVEIMRDSNRCALASSIQDSLDSLVTLFGYFLQRWHARVLLTLPQTHKPRQKGRETDNEAHNPRKSNFQSRVQAYVQEPSARTSVDRTSLLFLHTFHLLVKSPSLWSGDL